MSDWVLTAAPGLTALGLIVGIAVARTFRARSIVVLIAACACATLSILNDEQWLRTGYAVLALASAFGAGWLWSRTAPKAST